MTVLNNDITLDKVKKFVNDEITPILNKEFDNTSLPTSKIKINEDRLNLVLHDNCLYERKWNKIHMTYNKLLDTQDTEVIKYVNTCSLEELEVFMLNNWDNNSLWNFGKERKDLKGFTLMSYGGTKLPFRSHQVLVSRDIFSQNQNINKYCDCFFGIGGSTVSLFNELYENNIEVFVNDYNKKTINVHKRVKESPLEVQKEISKFCREMYVIFNGNEKECFDNKEGWDKVHSILKDRVQNKERNGKLDIQHSSLLIIWGNIPFTGDYTNNVEDKKGLSKEEVEELKYKNKSVSNYSKSLSPDKYISIFKKLQKKVERISQMYRVLDIQFETKDYKVFCKKHDSEDTLILLDPPYVECHEDYEEEPNFKEVKSCSYNYGLDWETKQHLEVLDLVSELNSEIMYWNYKHTVVKHYQEKNSFKELEIPFDDGTTGIPRINYLMWSNKKLLQKIEVNNKTYEPQQNTNKLVG